MYSMCRTWAWVVVVFLVSLLGVQASTEPTRRCRPQNCTNSADHRGCWGEYDISSNYYEEYPDTGVVREYWFNVVNTTAAPDGVERVILSINGTVPGPTIIADWGDTVVVHVTNSLADNGTSIHFHGIRQLATAQMDGVGAVTQCPVAPGSSYTYRWQATQYGSSWYHSHYSVQAWDGVFGGIVINGPASANYDEDLGTLMLNDWSHETADVMAGLALVKIPTVENGLLNGTNVYVVNNTDGTTTTSGQHFETSFEAGKRYRIRLVGAAADANFRFSIDGHTLKVIAADFVPIVPYTTEAVQVGMGQRYDIIVAADQTPGDYWMRSVGQLSCTKMDNENVLGIVRYDTNSTADPTTTASAAALVDNCDDEPAASLVPYVPITAGSAAVAVDSEQFSVFLYQGVNGNLWEMGDAGTFVSEWNYPSLQQVVDGDESWSVEQRAYRYPEANQWVYWIIQTNKTQPHPMHLHGHDFWVLGTGEGTYDPATANLTLVDAPRRDVVNLPGTSYVVIAFYTDNPGTWIMHCHIAWHLSEGLAVQIIEREDEIAATVDKALLADNCAAWKTWAGAGGIIQTDSGV